MKAFVYKTSKRPYRYSFYFQCCGERLIWTSTHATYSGAALMASLCWHDIQKSGKKAKKKAKK
jgi:hypothetical protein